MAITPSQQAVMRFVEEATAGTFPTNPVLKLFSKETTSVTLTLDKEGKESIDIGQLDVHEHYSTKNVYGVRVEFHLYDADLVMDNFIDRGSDGRPKAFSFEYIPDQDASTKHWYRMTGWRANEVSGSVDEDGAWVITIDFTGGKISDPVTVDPGIGTGSRQLQAGITDTLKTFATAAYTYNGSALATVQSGLEWTINSGLAAKYTMGDADPIAAATTHKVRRVSGQADISLDAGAKDHFDRVKAYAASGDLAIPFGTTAGDPILLLKNVRFPSLEIESAADEDMLMAGVPFTAEGGDDADAIDTTTTV